MVYRVLDVCRYIINYSNKHKWGISNLKLQKILYFVQAYFLINKDGEPCFEQEIEAWDFGPVVPEAYQEYKQFGSGNIPSIESYIEIEEGNEWKINKRIYDDSFMSNYDKELVNEVVQMFKDTSATDLVTLTHRQTPWKDSYKKYQNNVISKEAIRRYFDVES